MRTAGGIAAFLFTVVAVGGAILLTYHLDPTLTAQWHKAVFAIVVVILMPIDTLLYQSRRHTADIQKSPMLNPRQGESLLRRIRNLDKVFLRLWILGVCFRGILAIAAVALYFTAPSVLLLQFWWGAGYVAAWLSLPAIITAVSMERAMAHWRDEFVLAEKRESLRRQDLASLRSRNSGSDNLGEDPHLSSYTAAHTR